MPLPAALHALLTAAGPSGYESAPAAAFARAARAFCDDVEIDTLGTVTARVPGTQEGAPRLIIVGHIDEIGLIVTHIDEKGFLSFTGVGGWDPQILVGQRLDVLTEGGVIPGVIGKKPIHLLQPDDRKKAPELKDLHIDLGARDGDEAKALVRIGDVAVIAGDPVELRNDRVVGRSMDNRLGAFIALEAARLVAEAGGAPGDVIAVGAVQEEITFAGAQTSAFRLDPDCAVVTDVTHATDAPGIDVKQLGEHPLGSGAVIERGSTLHPVVTAGLIATAEREQIEHTLAATARATGTDADAVHLARAGIATGVVSIPLRYMHSPVELVQLSDIDCCARVIASWAQTLTPGTSLARG